MFAIGGSKSAEAAPIEDIGGYAWSSNIGWISFNCSNDSSCGTVSYGVTVDMANGDLSGYAWSSNIGWISFQETTGCPSGTCGAYIDDVSPSTLTGNKQVKGWARALSATEAGSGGWDGWIKLDSNQANPITYNFQTQQFLGYAWGSAVIGWISFSSQNLGTIPSYAVTGPGSGPDYLHTLGSIMTAPKCDTSGDSYLEIASAANGNVGNDFTYSAYSVSAASVIAALPTPYLDGGSSRIVARHYAATSTTSYRYAIYATQISTGLSTSTATSSLVSMPAGYTCQQNPGPTEFEFNDETFTLIPDTVRDDDMCTARGSFSHNGIHGTDVEVTCTLTSPPAAPETLNYQTSIIRDVSPGLHTYSCTIASSTDPLTVYDTFSIPRRCYKAPDVSEI